MTFISHLTRFNLATILLFWVTVFSVQAEVRTWTSSGGKFTIEAELTGISEDGKSVTLRRTDNGKETMVALEKLSDKDKVFVAKSLKKDQRGM